LKTKNPLGMDLADFRTERYIPLQDISFAGTASGMQPDKD